MVHGVRIETEAGVWGQTPHAGYALFLGNKAPGIISNQPAIADGGGTDPHAVKLKTLV